MITQRVDADHDVLGFTTDWVRELARHINHLEVLTGYEGRHDLPKNVRIFSYGKEREFPKWRRVATFERHCARLATDVDVVFVHMIPKYVLASYPWFRPAGTRFVLWYAHSSVTWDLRIAHRLVDRLVTSTEASFSLPSEKIEIVGQGIDMSKFTAGTVESDRTRLLGLGRVDPVKNFEVLIDAVSKLNGWGRDICLRVVGRPSSDGDYYTMLQDQARESGVADRVAFVGAIPHGEVIEEYRRAGLFLNASRTGSLDKTEVEAMACETPVISCNQAYKEMINESDMEGELLTFSPGNAEELAERINRLLDLSNTSYSKLGSACRTLVQERHSLESLMKSIITVLEDT